MTTIETVTTTEEVVEKVGIAASLAGRQARIAPRNDRTQSTLGCFSTSSFSRSKYVRGQKAGGVCLLAMTAKDAPRYIYKQLHNHEVST